MKALIISDLHSNIYALETIWAQEQDSDVIYCTGDLVDYGPYPREVLDWIQTFGVVCTQGNHDRWMIETYRAGKLLDRLPIKKRAWIHHNASLLNEEYITFLESLPEAIDFQLDGINYGMVHLYQDYTEIVSLHAYQEFCRQTFNGCSNPVFSRLIFGHTHRQGIRYLSDDALWVNPGSASYRRPDDPDQTAHYATITNGVISLKRLTYDLSLLQKYIRGVRLQKAELQVAKRFFGER